MNDDRRAALATGLEYTRERIRQVAQGRDVDLLVVTKTYPASDVALLTELGVRAVGENRDQEAKVKKPQSPDGIAWHMIGQIQRNKANSIARWADIVETLDRRELIEPLSRAAQRADKVLGVLIQINLDNDPMLVRGGCAPADGRELARIVAADPHLELLGVMGVAPHPRSGIDPYVAFCELAENSRAIVNEFPKAHMISAGMSGDLEEAIRAGATQVRLGSAILGERGSVQ